MDKIELVDKVDSVIENYSGSIQHLCTAIGVLFIVRSLGWRAIRLSFSPRVYSRCQKILDLDFKLHFQEEGDLARKSVVLGIVKKFHNFWNVVNGVEVLDKKEDKSLLINVIKN
jgi:hypothetical protein